MASAGTHHRRGWLGVVIAGALAGMLLAAAGVPAQTQPAPHFARDSLCIVGPGMRRHRFEVELAMTPSQRSYGLMFRRSLPADGGMLFLHPEPVPARMWMKNTYIPLDMLFIDAQGIIVHIAPDTVPESETVIEAGQMVPAVLELNAGTAAARGIRVGDRVLYAHFGARCD